MNPLTTTSVELVLIPQANKSYAYLGLGVPVPLLWGTGSKLAWELEGSEVQPS